ncbi:MAG: hypothetical protein RJA70_3752, partial [Pseudomonadota bacterium]
MSSLRVKALRRRRFLKGAAGFTCGSPLLSGLLGRYAQSESTPPPLRFYLMFTGNGQLPEHWIPSRDGTGYTPGPALAPLTLFRNQLLHVHGLQGAHEHIGGMTESTTGRPPQEGRRVPSGGPSIDQFFARAWRETTPLSSLELGVYPDNGEGQHTCYSASGLPIPAIASALGGFERAFAGLNDDSQSAARRRGRRQSVLDSVASDLTGLQAQLGGHAQVLLDEHLTLLREQEMSLLNPQPVGHCDLPATPNSDGGLTSTWKAHHETIVSAFRCGITRVATLRAGGLGGLDAGGYGEIGISDTHHAVAHGNTQDPVADE